MKLFLSCEHGGNKIPKEYKAYQGTDKSILKTHRAYDIGALETARKIEKKLRAPLYFSTITRLLADLNRSPENKNVISEYFQKLPTSERKFILDNYHSIYRRNLEDPIRNYLHSSPETPVLHIAVHSFTPELKGKKRSCDIGILYDPNRKLERDIAKIWKRFLEKNAPEFTVKLNYPYHGNTDGLPTHLRKQFPKTKYAGFELEMNQKLFTTNRKVKLQTALIESIKFLSNS